MHVLKKQEEGRRYRAVTAWRDTCHDVRIARLQCCSTAGVADSGSQSMRLEGSRERPVGLKK